MSGGGGRRLGTGAQASAEEQRVAALRSVATKPGNSACLECGQRGPTYVDVTLGAFVCSRCSGLLRGLTPPHRVKSISMATFTADEVSLVKSRGNDYCRSIWMGLYEGEQPSFKDEQKLKDFLSDKYEKRRYYLESSDEKRPEPIKESPPTQPIHRDNPWTTTPVRPVETPVRRPTNDLSFLSASIPPPVAQVPETSKFPVDFNNADIFNSSQMNNNLMPLTAAPRTARPFADFNSNPANTVTPDRYAALADLDFTLRQQNQNLNNDKEVPASSFNPFDSAAHTVEPRNPFWSNLQNQNMNGNVHYYSNPFIMGTDVAPGGQSKNPFL